MLLWPVLAWTEADRLARRSAGRYHVAASGLGGGAESAVEVASWEEAYRSAAKLLEKRPEVEAVMILDYGLFAWYPMRKEYAPAGYRLSRQGLEADFLIERDLVRRMRKRK